MYAPGGARLGNRKVRVLRKVTRGADGGERKEKRAQQQRSMYERGNAETSAPGGRYTPMKKKERLKKTHPPF